jgi:hypothetical protein
MDQSAGMLWIVSEAPFLGSSGICPNLSATHERLLCVDHMRYVWLIVIRGLSAGSVWDVGQVSLAGCISIRITATLGYEYRLFAAVIS